jgi:hypothetical protein
MPVDEKRLDEALALKDLTFPASLPVVRIEAGNYTDSGGEEALRILVVLDESVDEEHFSGEDILELKSSIHDRLQRHGIFEFPYISLVKQSELDEAEDEE